MSYNIEDYELVPVGGVIKKGAVMYRNGVLVPVYENYVGFTRADYSESFYNPKVNLVLTPVQETPEFPECEASANPIYIRTAKPEIQSESLNLKYAYNLFFRVISNGFGRQVSWDIAKKALKTLADCEENSMNPNQRAEMIEILKDVIIYDI
jgi:hypothetical protein